MITCNGSSSECASYLSSASWETFVVFYNTSLIDFILVLNDLAVTNLLLLKLLVVEIHLVELLGLLLNALLHLREDDVLCLDLLQQCGDQFFLILAIETFHGRHVQLDWCAAKLHGALLARSIGELMRRRFEYRFVGLLGTRVAWEVLVWGRHVGIVGLHNLTVVFLIV